MNKKFKVERSKTLKEKFRIEMFKDFESDVRNEVFKRVKVRNHMKNHVNLVTRA